jgi:hypothetical protein
MQCDDPNVGQCCELRLSFVRPPLVSRGRALCAVCFGTLTALEQSCRDLDTPNALFSDRPSPEAPIERKCILGATSEITFSRGIARDWDGEGRRSHDLELKDVLEHHASPDAC